MSFAPPPVPREPESIFDIEPRKDMSTCVLGASFVEVVHNSLAHGFRRGCSSSVEAPYALFGYQSPRKAPPYPKADWVMHVEGCDENAAKAGLSISGDQLTGSLSVGYTAPATLRWRKRHWEVTVSLRVVDDEWIEGSFLPAPTGGPRGRFRVCSWPHAPHRAVFSDIVVEPDSN